MPIGEGEALHLQSAKGNDEAAGDLLIQACMTLAAGAGRHVENLINSGIHEGWQWIRNEMTKRVRLHWMPEMPHSVGR
jgi:hypothetical protein